MLAQTKTKTLLMTVSFSTLYFLGSGFFCFKKIWNGRVPTEPPLVLGT